MVNRFLHKKKGFTLIEIILYVAVFAIVAALMVVILTTALQVGSRESSSAEVSAQLHFATQTIQRLVRASSNIDIQAGVPASTLRLRMPDPNQDHTVISLGGSAILMKQGTSPTSSITTSRVVVDSLSFEKITQYPGHDVVTVDVAISSNTQNPQGKFQRTISSAIGRVSAATFDSALLPGGTQDIGQAGTPWQNAFLSGVLNLGALAVDPPTGQAGALYFNTASSTFRGYRSAWQDLAPWAYNGTNAYTTNAGNVGVGIATPQDKLEVKGGNVYVTTSGKGIILKSPNGSVCALLTINNSGALATSTVACPD